MQSSMKSQQNNFGANLDAASMKMYSLQINQKSNLKPNLVTSAATTTATGTKCIDDAMTSMAIPNDAVRPGGKYEVQGFIWNSTCKTYLKVFVSHVYSPDRFYFQLIENEKLLAALMSKMQVFYESQRGNSYKMLADDIVLSLPVAAIYKTDQGNLWHRGLISSDVKESNCVEVFYVDYGTKDLVNLNNVRMLRKQYLPHYAQAIRGKLACVQTPDMETEWSQQVIDLMLEFVTNRPLICEVVGVEENAFSVNLCDTSKPHIDIYLNDLLVDKNLAERAPAPFPTVISLTQECYF